jgi:hypothetical protein
LVIVINGDVSVYKQLPNYIKKEPNPSSYELKMVEPAHGDDRISTLNSMSYKKYHHSLKDKNFIKVKKFETQKPKTFLQRL